MLYSYGQDTATMHTDSNTGVGRACTKGVVRDELADLIGEGMALQPLPVFLVPMLVTVTYEINGFTAPAVVH
jgi:hypothetical protein